MRGRRGVPQFDLCTVQKREKTKSGLARRQARKKKTDGVPSLEINDKSTTILIIQLLRHSYCCR
jgi:hypothetical protein